MSGSRRLRGLSRAVPLLTLVAVLLPSFRPLARLLGASVGVALAQDAPTDDAPPPPPPPPPPQDASWPETVKGWAATTSHMLLHTFGGRVILGLIVLMTLVRIYFHFRARAEAAGKRGEGVLGGYLSKKELEKLIAAGNHDAAAELLLTLGQGGKGPPGDPTREIEAAEHFLKAHRFARAAEILVRKGRPKRAAEAYERAQQFDLAAELFEKANELPRAEENYLKAKNKPAIARMWAAAGNSQKAAAYFAEISRPKEAAEHLEKLGKKPEAVEKYLEALSLISSGASPDAKGPRAGERNLGSDAEAKELFGRICKLYDETKDYEKYAQFLLKQGRADAAAEVFRKAGNLPRAAELLREGRHWDAAGRLMEEMGKHREALILFAQGRQERGEIEKSTELYLEAGEVLIAAENLEKLGKTARAAELFEKQKDLRRAADLYAKISDFKRAALLYEQVKQWNAAVFCWEQLGDLAHVAACWERAGNSFLAGVSYFSAHDPAKAIACLERVDKASEDRREAARLVGILLHETHKDKEALPWFEEGFGRKIEKDDVEAFYYYAQTLERIASEVPKAVSAYQTIQKLRPGYRDTDKRLAALKAGKPLPKTSIYTDGADDPGSLFHTSRFSLRGTGERARPDGSPKA